MAGVDERATAQRSAQLVAWYWAEARRCWDAGARHAYCVMTAAAMEAALIAASTLEEAAIRDTKRPSHSGNHRDWPRDRPSRWSLEDLVDAATAMGWAGVWEEWPTPPPDTYADLSRVLHTLRDVRNWLHPERLLRRGIDNPGVVPNLQLALAGAFLAIMKRVWPILRANGVAIAQAAPHQEAQMSFRIRLQAWEQESPESAPPCGTEDAAGPS